MDTPQSQSSNAPKRRVGIYERLGRSTGGSPAATFGMGLGVLAVLIILIVILSRYW
jgi:hypothetical protein